MGRKTFDVQAMREQANNLLKFTEAEDQMTPEYREGVIAMVENILHSSGNYHGFRYLTNHEMPETVKPGMWLDADGNLLDAKDRFVGTDNTRRHYF